MKKLRNGFLILLCILIIFTSCKNEKVIKVEEEPELRRTNVGFSATEYRLPVMEGYRDFEILKASKNKLYILVKYLDNEVEENPWKEHAHENLIVYNFQNEEILQNIKLGEFVEVKDLAIDTGKIYIIFKDLSILNIDDKDGNIQANLSKDDVEELVTETNQIENSQMEQISSSEEVADIELEQEGTKSVINIAKFDDDYNIETLDIIITDKLIPKFVNANDTIFYSYEEDGKYGIKSIKNGISENFYKFKDELIGNIYSNNKNLFALVKRGNSAYYYSIAIDGGVKEFYIEVREELSDYNFLKNGIISSYLDINDNEMPKLMYINLDNSKKNIFDNNIITSFISNNTNNCLMVDTASKLDYLYIKENELYTSEIQDYSGGNFKFYENENKRYGIRDLNRKYIYIDIYFE